MLNLLTTQELLVLNFCFAIHDWRKPTLLIRYYNYRPLIIRYNTVQKSYADELRVYFQEKNSFPLCSSSWFNEYRKWVAIFSKLSNFYKLLDEDAEFNTHFPVK